MATKLKQTCRSSGSAWSSVTERLIAADGGAGRPGWCQKVTQWNDASKTWLKHHMTHVCAEAHFPHNLLKLRRDIPPTSKIPKCWCECVCLLCQKKICPPWGPAQVTDSLNCFIEHRDNWHSDTGVAMETDGTIASPWSGLHFLALSGGACVSASGIWVRWWTIFIQSFARNPSIHLGIKRVSSWVTVKRKLGISLILWSVTLSLLQHLACHDIYLNEALVRPYGYHATAQMISSVSYWHHQIHIM